MDLTESRIDGTIAYEGHFLKVAKDRIRLPDGSEAQREYILHPGAVVVLPVFEDGRVLMERQYRYPLRRSFIEFPAGKIDAGESDLVCAQRELQEETGYTASQWQHVCTIHNAIAYSDERLELFLARGLTAGTPRLDEGEFLETYTATVPELLAQVRAGQITDVKTVIGIFWLDKLAAGNWSL
ncbi:NUDIX domain-containing protein [Massilia sp. TS11]|uniref:NUDIX domain-containing protein n=1 Tax=Massilia sp. TS11 TaxID=2908003 RepID=UPI001EDC5B67|nr:NUDIX hydrolase [Massilia sp. TS11]MCG2583244.1 NUDIX hydrolase [Massilia sp. TS11]